MTGIVDCHAARLERQGYCILPHAVEPGAIAELGKHLADAFAHTPMGVGPFYGERTRRFGALLRRSSVARMLALHPVVLGIVEQQLLPWCDRIALNLTQAIEIHPGAPAQLPHRDQDMWPGPKGAMEYLVNVMWPLTPFGAHNGGTRLWPESHVDQHIATLPEAEAIVPAVLPGDALIFLGSTLHGGGANRDALPRRGVIISYCLGWLKPFELQWLVYPPSLARTFDPPLAALVGYAQHRPNLGNVEGQCPSILLGDSLPLYIGAVDALRPDQQLAAAAFHADPDRD
ncbi:phytanoyl-CoA dioxygenase family protein [Rhizorhabdus dicambivorans]|uniref:Phytanoyl-CoA dioxygenase n=1 Tax=Rhizorhabdus dicambivorans TaxID=1850238 RepID=A0A2A4FQX8_9SPHN|nr:phytanoyl-CoA dioxygenase family protein [Rhizorhabdus dicambivorans]ATE66343.1 phytanoyl-CoA dioxygenase [Rhizorhabdus dicambivorans]PCE40124.1 phytanoyl-CoA dioxygenase [Rhizorhabdus dicambivorans]